MRESKRERERESKIEREGKMGMLTRALVLILPHSEPNKCFVSVDSLAPDNDAITDEFKMQGRIQGFLKGCSNV